jgi:hypothetical protein
MGHSTPARLETSPTGGAENVSLFLGFTINSLLGEYEELEKQTIYFASPEELNDPIDGVDG